MLFWKNWKLMNKSIESSALTPRAIVKELNRFIVGQKEAKKCVALALRNRWRRMQLESPLREEILPKNILMIGPTGVGKTEIARRLAKLVEAPFIKVEATKFTEIGYVGKDVEQIIRDLVEIAIALQRDKLQIFVQEKAKKHVQKRILDALVGEKSSIETREKFQKRFEEGKLEGYEIELSVKDTKNPFTSFDIPGMNTAQMGMVNLGDLFGKALGEKTKMRRLTIREARKILMNEESDKLVDQERIIQDAIQAVEQRGIVFLDEIDKICNRTSRQGGEVSREGVQRDLLPLIEGTSVSTKYGMIKTDHILFVASGAFHASKPSDLLPELQGRLPIRVELQPLSEKDFVKILTEPESNLIIQYRALLKTEGVELNFDVQAIDAIAKLAVEVNTQVENIGARRLHTILEKLLEDISFEASEKPGSCITIDASKVWDSLGSLAKNKDLSQFIL